MRRRTFLRISAGVSVSALPGFRSASKATGRVVVVGGGIIGSSIAYHLARRGAEVTVCEKQAPASGATSKSFAWINASAGKQPYHYYRLNRLSALAYRRLEADVGGDFQVKWGGSLEWAEEPEDARTLRRNVARQQAWGYPIHLIQDSEFRALEPDLRPAGPVLAATRTREEGSIDPERATLALLEAGKEQGVRVEYPCEVTGIDLRWGSLRGVDTTRGRLEADALVIAAGVDTPRLGTMVGLTVPLRDSPGLLAHSQPGPDLLGRVALAPSGAMKQKLDGSLVVSGGFDGRPVSDDPRGQAEEILERAKKLIPDARHIELARHTIGWRPLPADGHPVLGFSEGAPDVYLAVMHSGITLAPLVGQLVASEILDGVQVDLLEHYRPSRFEG
ncbi:MAG: FAD-binding oxidoreductase [Gemmatimonadota bacterium]|nr:FAD-binding oxidoreductase [Gemmatimonadota bacterium]